MIRNILHFFALISLTAGTLLAQPEHTIFTYMGNPSTTLTANWQNLGADISFEDDAAFVFYDTVARNGDIEAYAQNQEGRSFRIEGLDDRTISRVQLEGLKPDTVYYLTVGHPQAGFSEEFSVKTIPVDASALRFVTGGDMGPSKETQKLLRNAATYDPDFAVVGGDIAYADGKLENVSSWDAWLTYYTEEMLTSDKRSIPVVFAIGNHEVLGGFNKTMAEAPFFFGFFGQDVTKTYFSRQFGSNFLLLVLDTGHIATHESQVDWIDSTLSDYDSMKYKSAVYHFPLFPSHRDFKGDFSKIGRKHWSPLFDKYGLTVAFENHDHTYKRSHLIRHGEVSSDGSGTLYLGDGCWGIGARPIDFGGRPYLRKAGSILHFWVVDVSTEKMVYRAVDMDNRAFDVYPESEPDVAEASQVFDSIDQLYKLPDGVMQVLDIRDAEDPWRKGESSAILENTLDHPLSITLSSRLFGRELLIEGLHGEAFILEPGERRVFPFEIRTGIASGISLEDMKVIIDANAKLLDPNAIRTTRFAKISRMNISKK